MVSVVFSEKVNTSINTIQGIADYSHSEVEDENGKWDDQWQTTRGEYVIHEGPQSHHVYFVRGSRK